MTGLGGRLYVTLDCLDDEASADCAFLSEFRVYACVLCWKDVILPKEIMFKDLGS